jgi:hypothetical protein
MGVVSMKWDGHECRSEDGVLFSSDQFVSLTGSPQSGYRAGTSESLELLLSRGAGGWIEIDLRCRCRDDINMVIVEAGGGFYEGEGFVAVISQLTGELAWVLHLSDSEAFTAVSVDGAEVVALAEEYPIRNEYRIPLSEPYLLRTVSNR